MRRYALAIVAALLLTGCASAPPHQDTAWQACWVGEWIAC